MDVSKMKRKIAMISILIELNDVYEEEDACTDAYHRGPDRVWIRERPLKGAYVTLFKDLELTDKEGFRRFMRMDIDHFKQLLSIVAPDLTKNETNMRKAICPEERLAVTLRFLATGETFRSLEFNFRISRKAISYIVLEVVEVIFRKMGPEYLSLPSSKDEWLLHEKVYRERWNFPHCVGALDGKHIRIQGCNLGSQYHNYKGTHSIIMMIAAGGNYEVIWADVGTNGRVSDGAVLKRSSFGERIDNNTLGLPEPSPLPGRIKPTPYVFIGDEAFALSQNIMKPFSRQNLDVFTRICNYRFSRARRISENVFGILSCKWRIFLTTIALHPRKVRKICLGVLTLHNWLRSSSKSYFPSNLPDRFDISTKRTIPGAWREGIGGEEMLPLEPIRFSKNATIWAKEVREEFKEYFNCQGAVPWQWDLCMN